MGIHPGRHQHARAHLDGGGVALLFQRIRRVELLQQPGIGQRRTLRRIGGRLAAHALGLLDVQFEALGSRLERLGLLVDHVGQGLGSLVVAPCRLFLTPHLHQLGLDLGQRLFSTALHTRHLDDVEAILGLHYVGEARLVQPEGRIGKGLDHRVTLEEAQIAPLLGRARVLGVLLRQLGKLVRMGLGLGQQRLGTGLHLLLGRCIGPFRHLQQDMAGLTLLGLVELVAVLLVVGLQLFLGRLDILGQHVGAAQRHIADVHRLGQVEGGRMGVVIGLELLIGRCQPLLVVTRGHQQRANHPPVLLGGKHAVHHGLRHHRRIRHRTLDGAHGQHLAHLRLVLRRRQAIGCQQPLVALDVELAVGIPQISVLVQDGLLDLARRDRDAGTACIGQHGLAGDQVLQHLHARGLVVEDGGIIVVAHHLLHLLHLLPVRLLEIGTRHRLAIDGCHRVAIAEHPVVAGDAEEDEGRHDQHQQQPLGQALVGSDEIKHGDGDPIVKRNVDPRSLFEMSATARNIMARALPDATGGRQPPVRSCSDLGQPAVAAGCLYRTMGTREHAEGHRCRQQQRTPQG